MRNRNAGVSSITLRMSVYYMIKVTLALFVACSAAHDTFGGK